MRRFLLACVLTPAALAALPGQEITPNARAGDFVFQMPPGWNRVERGNMTLIVAPLPPPGTTTYIALAADKSEGDLRNSFNVEWKGFLRQYRIVQGGQPVKRRLSSGDDAYYVRAIVMDAKGQRVRVAVLTAQFGERIETVMFLSNVFSPELAATYDGVFERLLSSIRFTSAEEATSVPPAGATTPTLGVKGSGTLPRGKGKFDGIYRAVTQTGDPLSPARGLHYSYVAFFPDARMMEGIPDEGLDQFDEDSAIRRNPVGWGTYQMNGEEGRILFPPDEYSSNAIVWPIKEYPDRLMVHGDTYHLLERCNGLKLQGTFRRSDYKTTYSANQGITFSADGSFADEGVFKAAGVMVRNAQGGFDFDDGAPGRGTYRVANYTLELRYSNGRVKRTSFYLEPGTDKSGVREFYLNTWKFSRVQ